MISRLILLSIFIVSTAFMMSAENADSCVQSQRTQEQFQQEFNEFIKNTRAYMLAKEIIPIDSVHLLNKEQKQILESAKKFVNKNNSELPLPYEINYLLGDTIVETRYKVKPIWEESYFVNKDSLELIIPLHNNSLEIAQCRWSIKGDSIKVYNQVETVIGGYEDSVKQFTGNLVYSSSFGRMNAIYNFDKGECVEVIRNDNVLVLKVAPQYRKNIAKASRKHKNKINYDVARPLKKIRTGSRYINEPGSKSDRDRDMEAFFRYEFRTRDRSNTK